MGRELKWTRPMNFIPSLHCIALLRIMHQFRLKICSKLTQDMQYAPTHPFNLERPPSLSVPHIISPSIHPSVRPGLMICTISYHNGFIALVWQALCVNMWSVHDIINKQLSNCLLGRHLGQWWSWIWIGWTRWDGRGGTELRRVCRKIINNRRHI